MTTHDNREEEHDWSDDDLTHLPNTSEPETAEPAEREDDSAPLPVRHPHGRRPSRRRGAYRPPSELDSE